MSPCLTTASMAMLLTATHSVFHFCGLQRVLMNTLTWVRKYICDFRGHVIDRLFLNIGEHKFKYAIYPHAHHFNNSQVVRQAIEFNIPVSVRCVKGLKSGSVAQPVFEMDPPDRIILDTIKPAEDDSGRCKTIILRLYEAYGGQTTSLLKR